MIADLQSKGVPQGAIDRYMQGLETGEKARAKAGADADTAQFQKDVQTYGSVSAVGQHQKYKAEQAAKTPAKGEALPDIKPSKQSTQAVAAALKKLKFGQKVTLENGNAIEFRDSSSPYVIHFKDGEKRTASGSATASKWALGGVKTSMEKGPVGGWTDADKVSSSSPTPTPDLTPGETHALGLAAKGKGGAGAALSVRHATLALEKKGLVKLEGGGIAGMGQPKLTEKGKAALAASSPGASKSLAKPGKKPYSGGPHVVLQNDGSGNWSSVGGANTPEAAKKLAAKFPGTTKVVDNQPGSEPHPGTYTSWGAKIPKDYKPG